MPKVHVTNDFMMNVLKDGGVQLKYGDPDGVAGLVVNVDKAGVLGFEIRAAQNHPCYDASGTDMFVSAMQRLGNEGIKPVGLGRLVLTALTLLDISRILSMECQKKMLL